MKYYEAFKRPIFQKPAKLTIFWRYFLKISMQFKKSPQGSTLLALLETWSLIQWIFFRVFLKVFTLKGSL